MAQLKGIFTPNIVPLDARGEIAEDELRRYVDWLIERGVHGLYPNGSTGEFTRSKLRAILAPILAMSCIAARRWPARSGVGDAGSKRPGVNTTTNARKQSGTRSANVGARLTPSTNAP